LITIAYAKKLRRGLLLRISWLRQGTYLNRTQCGVSLTAAQPCEVFVAEEQTVTPMLDRGEETAVALGYEMKSGTALTP
jgi:hypothetical protein